MDFFYQTFHEVCVDINARSLCHRLGKDITTDYWSFGPLDLVDNSKVDATCAGPEISCALHHTG